VRALVAATAMLFDKLFCCCAAETETSTSIPVGAIAATSEAESGIIGQEEPPEQPLHPPLDNPSSGDAVKGFKVTLTKASLKSPLGLHVDLLDERLLYVCMVLPGGGGQGMTAVEAHNRDSPQDLSVQQGDYIAAVNGETTAMTMREALKNGQTLELEVLRPVLFKRPVKMAKGESMGLDLNFGPNACSLLITQVKGGGVVARAAPDVAAGDRIISVNGMKGNTEELLRCIQCTEDPVLGLSRPPRMLN